MGRPKGSVNKSQGKKAVTKKPIMLVDPELSQATLNTIMVRLNSLGNRMGIMESNLSEIAQNQSTQQDHIFAEWKKAMTLFKAELESVKSGPQVSAASAGNCSGQGNCSDETEYEGDA